MDVIVNYLIVLFIFDMPSSFRIPLLQIGDFVGNKTNEQITTSQEIERLWTWLLNEATLYTNRVNFYIVAQSMFFVAFASSTRKSQVFLIACSISGILLSIIWLIMSKHQNQNVVAPLRKALYKNWNVAERINYGQKTMLRTHFLLGVVLPWFMIILWIWVLLAELLSWYPLPK